MKWFGKAAEQGNARAQGGLALRYATGEGVLKDYVTAHMWANLAAAEGKENSGKKIKDILTKHMTKEQIAEAQKMSSEWMAKHSEKE